MKIKNTIIPLLATAGVSHGALTTLTVVQDQWIGAQSDGSGYGSNATVAEGGTGDRLSLWQPGPPNAWQYNRRAYFGFDVSSIDLSTVTAAVFNVTTAGNMAAGENGRNIYYWIHADNSGGDAFDETTLSKNLANTLGLNANGQQVSASAPYNPETRGAGTLLQASGVGIAAADGSNSITFSAAALTELLGDTNNFVTISAYAGAPTGGAYGGVPNATTAVTTTGPGFESKELIGGTAATLDLTYTPIPEPSSTALLGLGALGLMIRRKR